MQVADVVFPALDIPERSMRFVLAAALLGFPAALVFGWFFDLTSHGIQRTEPADPKDQQAIATLRSSDYVILAALAFVAVAISYSAYTNVMEGPGQDYRDRSEGPPMVAVLPFVSKSLEGESEFFAVGVHDDLLTKLAQISALRVISRTSVMEYKDVERNIRDIGAELGADAILEGGVQMYGNNIRINAQLIDAHTDEHLWAETYDRELSPTSIFDVQADIAYAIANSLRATLTDREASQISEIPTENMGAYRAYHQAMEVFAEKGSFLQDEVRILLEEAVELDPNFTRAWAELAGHLAFQNFYANYRPEFIGRPEKIIERIRAIAPDSADYLMAQAYFSYYTLRDYDLANRFVSRAIEMRPSDMRLYELKTWIQRRQGDWEGRIETLRQAQELDPRDLSWNIRLAYNLMVTHRYAEALEQVESANIDGFRPESLHNHLLLQVHGDIEQWAAGVARVHREYEDAASGNEFDLWDSYMAVRNYDAAENYLTLLQDYRSVGEVQNPHLSDRNVAEILTYWLAGKTDLLEQSLQRGMAHLDKMVLPDGSLTREDAVAVDFALIAAVKGNKEEAERLNRRGLRAMESDQAVLMAWRHFTCRPLGLVGATAAAVECIRDSLTNPSLALSRLEPFLPYYDSIRDDPAFVALLEEFGVSYSQL
jgi:TolB-like protein/Tfp pilus assembly protein PilF